MKFRRVACRVPRKRAVWVNIPFGSVAFSEVVGNQDLLVPEDWEASFTGLTSRARGFARDRRGDRLETDDRRHSRRQRFLGHLHGWGQ